MSFPVHHSRVHKIPRRRHRQRRDDSIGGDGRRDRQKPGGAQHARNRRVGENIEEKKSKKLRYNPSLSPLDGVLRALLVNRRSPATLGTASEAGIDGSAVVDLGDLIVTIEQRGGLLESAVLGLHNEDDHERQLECEPHAVDDVVLPAELREGDGVGVLIEDERERDGEVEHGETLGAELVRKNLDGVGDDEGGVGDVVRAVVEEDEGDDSVGGGVASSDGVSGRADGLHDEEDKHADVGGDEEGSSADTVAEETSDDGNSEIVDLEDTVDQVLDGDVGDADGVEHLVEVVGDETVTRPLRELWGRGQCIVGLKR